MNFLLDIGAEGDNFYCDCPIGSRGHICKHFPGISYKLGLLQVTDDVRSKPLRQKRKPGRPRLEKPGQCPARSSEKSSDAPVALYHPPSPELILELYWRIWALMNDIPVILPMTRLRGRLQPRELSHLCWLRLMMMARCWSCQGEARETRIDSW